ncbi:MAG: hypothetical protein ACLUDR_12380 [Blautia wexlerae]
MNKEKALKNQGLEFREDISYRWGDAWTPPLPEVAVILLIVVSSVILAVHGPIKRIRNMSIVDTISAQ